MEYRVYYPDHRLRSVIRKYYLFRIPETAADLSRTMFADGSIDLILNLGPAVPIIEDHAALEPGTPYLCGVMTSFIKVKQVVGSTLIGIQFHPGGLQNFFDITLPEWIDRIRPFPPADLPVISQLDPGWVDALDKYFLSGLRSRSSVLSLTSMIEDTQGQIPIKRMAKTHGISNRTLERIFVERVGITPKQYAGFVRYRLTLGKIFQPEPKTAAFRRSGSLMQLAFELGYYDHAHLTREIKRYTSMTPSRIQELDPQLAQLVFKFMFC